MEKKKFYIRPYTDIIKVNITEKFLSGSYNNIGGFGFGDKDDDDRKDNDNWDKGWDWDN